MGDVSCDRCGHDPHDFLPDPRCGAIVGGGGEPFPEPVYCACLDIDLVITRLRRAEGGVAAPASEFERWLRVFIPGGARHLHLLNDHARARENGPGVFERCEHPDCRRARAYELNLAAWS